MSDSVAATYAGSRILRLGLRGVRYVALFVVLAFLVGPSLIVAIVSFSRESFIKFPPLSWGFDHYVDFFRSSIWLGALRRSVFIAAASGLGSVVVGTLFVFGVQRTQLRRSSLLDFLILGPVIVPATAYAVAMYSLYADLRLVGSAIGIMLIHTLLALPFVVLILGSAMTRIRRELEYAAMSLGASRLETYWYVTLRLLAAGIAASALFAFITSFDEAVFVSFLSGPGFTTLPLEIFNSLKTGVDPVVTAISTILIVFTGFVMILFGYLRRGLG